MLMKASEVEKYINGFPKEVQDILIKIQNLIQSLVPNANQTISYGLPTFKLNGKNLVYFGGWQKHIGFYPTPSGTDKFQHQLKPYKSGKGSIQFPLNQPMPYALIKDIVKFRVAEIEKTNK